jgi:hypothetical protein
MQPDYRLGCNTVNGCPPGVPADRPAQADKQYIIDYSHDETAYFLWDDGSIQAFHFAQDYLRAVCELVNAMTPTGIDCRELASFRGSTQYAIPSQHALDGMKALQASAYVNDTMFGTSVRGTWTLDIRRTLTQLNGRAGDACYEFGTANPSASALPEVCYPAGCLDPCFDNFGNRRASNDPDAPAYCSCYDANGLLADSTSDHCIGQPSELTFVKAALPPSSACSALDSYPTRIEAVCTPFATADGRLLPHGNLQCCTESGFLKAELSSSQLATCATMGFDSDTACRTPDVCYEICGPRCKAFKDALVGFEYVIHWRAD